MSTDPATAGDRLKNNPNLVRCASCTAIMSKKATTCPKCGLSPVAAQKANSNSPGNEVSGFAGLDLAQFGVPTVVESRFPAQTTPSQFASPNPSQQLLNKARAEQKARDQKDESGGGIIWLFAPWTVENVSHKYGNLHRFNQIYSSMARVSFVFLLIISLLGFVAGGIVIPIGILLGSHSPETPRIELYFTAFLCFCVTLLVSILLLLLGHLQYILTIAVTDYFRCLMDTEANTRKR